MANRVQPPAEVTAYADKYKKMVEKLVRDRGVGGPDRVYEDIRHLAFAMVDPNCPLHWFVTNEAPPSHKYVADHLLPLDKSQVARVLYRASGTLGLYEPTGKRRYSDAIECRPWKAGDSEFPAINDMRRKLEVETFLTLHQQREESCGRNAIEDLQDLNKKIGRTKQVTDDLLKTISPAGPLTLEEGLWSEPVVGYQAEVFWESDRAFHLTAAKAVGMKLHADMLRILLERIRLSGSDRKVILERAPTSHREHDDIVKAVSSGTRSDVVEAVAAHFRSSDKSYGFAGEMKS